MNKQKTIAEISSILSGASAAECEIALEFLKHLAPSNDAKITRAFAFTAPDAINIAYIVRSNQNNPKFLHKLLVRAVILEKLFGTVPDYKE